MARRQKQEEWERKKKAQVAKEAETRPSSGRGVPSEAVGEFRIGGRETAESEPTEEGRQANQAEKQRASDENRDDDDEDEAGTEIAAWRDGLDCMLLPSYQILNIEKRAFSMSGAVDSIGANLSGDTTSAADEPTPAVDVLARDYSGEIEAKAYVERQFDKWTTEAARLRRLLRPGMRQLLSFLAYVLHLQRRYALREYTIVADDLTLFI